MIHPRHPMSGNPPVPAGPTGTAGRVTREMVYARTRSLAVAAGRSALQISQADYEQARRELTGESEMARQEAKLDDAPAPGVPEPGRSATPWTERGPPARGADL
jgi:hypothetical protein